MGASEFEDQELTVCAVCGKKEPCECSKDFRPAQSPKRNTDTFENDHCKYNTP